MNIRGGKCRLLDARDFVRDQLREFYLSAMAQYATAEASCTKVFHFVPPFFGSTFLMRRTVCLIFPMKKFNSSEDSVSTVSRSGMTMSASVATLPVSDLPFLIIISRLAVYYTILMLRGGLSLPYSRRSDVALRIEARRPGMISPPIFAAAKVRRPASLSEAPVQNTSLP